jgi:hypothetical protein
MIQTGAASLAALAAGCATTDAPPPPGPSYPPRSLNRDVMDVVAEMRAIGQSLRAANPEARYYRLPDAAFTEPLTYAGQSIAAGDYYPATNCSTACFEAFVRTLNRVEARQGGVYEKLSFDDLAGRRGYPLRSWMMRTKSFDRAIGAASPRFRSMVGPADGFVLYGIGDIIEFPDAAPGDFVQFHRWTQGAGGVMQKYNQGHAVIFTGFLDAARNDAGASVITPSTRYNAATNCGFTYFSSNGPTNGLADRYAFFYDKKPADAMSADPWDRNVQEPTSKDDLYALSLARVYEPSLWRRESTSLRIDAYISGQSIYALETENRLYAERSYDPRFANTVMAAADMDAATLAERAARDAVLEEEFQNEIASITPMYNMEE